MTLVVKMGGQFDTHCIAHQMVICLQKYLDNIIYTIHFKVWKTLFFLTFSKITRKQSSYVSKFSLSFHSRMLFKNFKYLMQFLWNCNWMMRLKKIHVRVNKHVQETLMAHKLVNWQQHKNYAAKKIARQKIQ